MEIERRRVLTCSLAVASMAVLPGCTQEIAYEFVEVMLESMICDGYDCLDDDDLYDDNDDEGGKAKNALKDEIEKGKKAVKDEGGKDKKTLKQLILKKKG